jgi:hypothetical protein
MKFSYRRGVFWVLVGLVAGGCQFIKPSPKSTEPPAPMHYAPARDGLPTTKIWKSQIAFGDINGDGFPDIGAVSRLADGPWIWAGDGKGHWTDASAGLPRESFCGGGMKFADINNDGKMDVAIADHCRGVFVYLGDGTGHWTNSSGGLPTAGSEDVAIGDFNHDGCLDLVTVASGEEGVRVYNGDCKGRWKESSGTGLPHGEWGNAVTVADMDGDGNLDIVAAYAPGPRVWLGDGKGNWREGSEGLPAPDIHGLYWGIAVGDVNGDGKPDIATGAALPGAEVFIQETGPNGIRWRKASQGIVPMNALGVALGDLNNDGKLDLVVVGKTNLEEIGGVYGVFPFLGDGTGNWKLIDNTGLPTTGRERTWGVGLADIDRDGVLDIGVAFGDVLSPKWRSGSLQKPTEGSKKKGKGKEKKSEPAEKREQPQRGMFGSIEVWRGAITR